MMKLLSKNIFRNGENAFKIMITIDMPLDRTVTTLGVSLRTVDRVYLESQATGVHIYHTVNRYSPEQV